MVGRVAVGMLGGKGGMGEMRVGVGIVGGY